MILKMKFRSFFLVLICIALIYSCRGARNVVETVQPDPTEIYNEGISRVELELAKIDEEISTTDVTVRTESVTPVEPERTLYRFYVIIGSFRDFNNARQYNMDLIRKGFSPEVLESEHGLFRVSVGGFNVESAARARIAEIRTRYAEHRDVWLLVRR